MSDQFDRPAHIHQELRDLLNISLFAEVPTKDWTAFEAGAEAYKAQLRVQIKALCGDRSID